MDKFVVIEGLDGSGKSTQIRLLKNYLDSQKTKYKYLHFPRTDSPVYGEMISRFLRGEFGKVNSVNPYFVALLYAGDRENAKPIIKRWLSEDYIVIVDRYVYSNIAFQCAKVDTSEEKEELEKWVLDLEYGYNMIASPSISIYLHVPFEFTTNKLADRQSRNDRTYLNGKVDIHEASIELQRKVESEYLKLVDKDRNFHIINCSSSDSNMLPPEVINSEIIKILISQNIVEK
ncbi:MAG: dTMP kinase [Sedimentisphaerales bacterium]|nr:dTMP kinase [Sedimentisphaerales bacterium]